MATNIWQRPFADPSAQATTTNQYYQPGNSYGGSQDWYDTPISESIREQNLDLAYADYGNQIGVNNHNTAFRDWFQSEFPQYQRAYGLATMRNPLITIDQFTQTLPGMAQLQQIFRQQSPYQRGERNQLYAPIARWITR